MKNSNLLLKINPKIPNTAPKTPVIIENTPPTTAPNMEKITENMGMIKKSMNKSARIRTEEEDILI